MEEYKLPNGLDLDKLRQQVDSEYNSSIDSVETKRDLWRSRDDLYMNISNQDEKVYVRLIFSTIQTMKALSSANDISVRYYGRRLGTRDIARNWQNLAKFDYREMWLFKKKEQLRDDLFKYWVGIEAWDWWDANRKCPKTIVVDPRTWVWDKYYDVNNGFSFHGFEISLRKWDLDAKRWYFNVESCYTDKQIEEIKEYARAQSNSKELDKISMDTVRLLGPTIATPDDLWIYSIYRHYTIVDWVKYCTEWANDRTELIRCYEIPAVSKAEKKDKSLVKRPVITRNWIEQPGDPTGISIPDILEDKQRMMQLFLNLNKIKAEYEAYGDVFFYDPNVVKNIDTLKIPPKGWPRYIKADLRTGTPMIEAPKSAVKADAWNMPWIMQQQGMLDIGIDSRTMGVTPEGVISATENQRVQNNANLRMLLGIKLYNEAEREFWEILWRKQYKLYFKLTDEKNIIINTWLWLAPMTIKYKDIGCYEDIDIDIVSKIEKEEEDTKKLKNITPIMNFVLTRPGSKFGKDDLLRKVFQRSWASEEDALSWIEPSKEEIRAMEDVELINNWEDANKCEDVNEDHRTYLVIYQNAIPNEYRARAIEARTQLHIQSWQAAEANSMMKQLGNNDNLSNTQQQLTSSALNQQGNAAQSAQSLQGMM